MGVKHPTPLNCQQIIKTNTEKGREKKQGKERRRDRKDWRNYSGRGQIGIREYNLYFIQVLNHTQPDIMSIQIVKRSYQLSWSFLFRIFSEKVCIKSRKLRLKIAQTFIASEGDFQTSKICKLLLIIFCMLQSINVGKHFEDWNFNAITFELFQTIICLMIIIFQNSVDNCEIDLKTRLILYWVHSPLMKV